MIDYSPGLFQHYKGGYYYLLMVATIDGYDPYMGHDVIVYANSNGQAFTRPVNNFFELVEVDGTTRPRFMRVQS